MLQTIMAPEFVVGFASGQKVEAQRSVAMFREKGYDKWTLRHGFYANMGGFHVKPKDTPEFPINATQLLYLIEKNYMDFPSISAKDVWDKSKADGFQKTFTCIQTGWFLVQCLGRAIQRLPVTTLELTTLGFVFCTLVMYIQWANKPLDVASPTILPLETKIEEILRDGGPRAAKPYRQTPLDFIDDLSPSWLTELQPHLRFRRGPPDRPLRPFTNDRFPVIAASLEAICLFFVSLIYCGLHFIAWNFSFPTRVERILWHAASITMIATALVFWVCEIIQDGVRIGRWKSWAARWRRWCDRASPSQQEKSRRVAMDPAERADVMFIPIWEVAIMLPVTLLYSLARTYICVEIFASQRSLPRGAFETVDWTKYIPHL